MKAVLLAAILLSGCATVSWTCPERPVITRQNTHTIVKCKSTGNTVDITHPAHAP